MLSTIISLEPSHGYLPMLLAALLSYILVVRSLRFKRCRQIEAIFTNTGRPLSTMTVNEAHQIVRELRELEFPYTMHTAMKVSLLKTGSIPTMTKLFVATGQLNEKNASKRAADTEIVLNEVHDREPGSDSHLLGIARMNYLHARFRKAGKILDEDMLHTLGSAVVDIVRLVDRQEWRGLAYVERCAVGVFHKALGDAMEIPFTFLPSYKTGWRDGGHFVQEICEWTLGYEKAVARCTESNRTIGRRLMGLAKVNVPAPLRPLVESVVTTKLDEHIRISMGFSKPNVLVKLLADGVLNLRWLLLRYLSLPRPESMRVRLLNDSPNPATGLWNVRFWIAHPWYVEPSFKYRWGLKALVAWLFGTGAVPTRDGEYRESGYSLWNIGPAAQEKRGRDEMEAIFADLKKTDFAGGCPFHQ